MHSSCAQALHGPEAIAGMHRLPQARHHARQEHSGCPLTAQGTLHRPCRGGTPHHPFRSGAAAGAAAHGQPELSEELPEEDASRAILEEIAAEDAQVAAQDAGAPVFDLFPQKAAPLSPKQQRERAAKLTGRPLRAPAASRRRTRRSADLLDARQQGDIGSMGALAKALDVRPQRPLAPVPHLEPVAAQQAQLDTASPYVPRQDGSEGIGSYAQKLAKAGLDLSANPREVVYNHPMAAMARLDAAIAAGYDPDAEFRSMLGRLMTDDKLEDAAELDDDGSVPKAQEGQPESMTPDLDAEFNEQLSEEERRDEQGMMNPEWDADMDVMDDEEEDSLADNFDRALSETMAAKEDNDREGFAVWEGDEEEIEDGDDMASIDDIVGRLTKSRAGGGTGKEQKKPDLKKPQFSWRDFGPGSRPVRRPD